MMIDTSLTPGDLWSNPVSKQKKVYCFAYRNQNMSFMSQVDVIIFEFAYSYNYFLFYCQVTVTIRLTILEILEISTVKKSFSAEVIMRAKWREPDLDGQTEIVRNHIIFLLMLKRPPLIRNVGSSTQCSLLAAHVHAGALGLVPWRS